MKMKMKLPSKIRSHEAMWNMVWKEEDDMKSCILDADT